MPMRHTVDPETGRAWEMGGERPGSRLRYPLVVSYEDGPWAVCSPNP